MTYQWLAAISLVKILAAFLLFFVYLPAKLWPGPPGDPAIDRFFENFVRMAATSIVLVHLLALLQVYSIVALLFCCAVLPGAMSWWRRGELPFKRLRRFRVRNIVLVLDVLDRVVDLEARLAERFRAKLARWKERAGNRPAIVHAVLFGVVLAYSGALRYLDVFRSAAFGFSDPYTHLLWMKELQSGTLYPAGSQQFYPKGFHAFLSVLDGLTGLDSTLAIRLTGPLVGVLLVLAVYFVGRQLTGNAEAALVGMAAYGTSVGLLGYLDSHFLEEGALAQVESTLRFFTRQTAPLPEEFALVFLLPALLWAYAYVVTGEGRRLVQFCLASICVFTIHSLVGLALGVGVAVLFVLSVLHWRFVSFGTLVRLAGAAAGSALAGNLQIVFGWFFAAEVREQGEKYFTSWLAVLGPQPYTLEILGSAALGLLVCVAGITLIRGSERKLLWSFVGLYLLVLVFLGLSLNFRVRYLISPDRVANYRMFLFAAALSGVYYLVTFGPLLRAEPHRARWVHQAITALAVLVLGVTGFPSTLATASSLPVPRYEYDALARISHRIKRTFPPLEWTIVSTIEDYSQILRDGGWHMNVDEFLARYNPYDREPALPTPYTLLFVEKKPFPVSSFSGLNKPGVRLDLERRLQEWTGIYRMLHDDLSVVYEDWDVSVYLVARHLMKGRPAGSGSGVGLDRTPARLLDRLRRAVPRRPGDPGPPVAAPGPRN